MQIVLVCLALPFLCCFALGFVAAMCIPSIQRRANRAIVDLDRIKNDRELLLKALKHLRKQPISVGPEYGYNRNHFYKTLVEVEADHAIAMAERE